MNFSEPLLKATLIKRYKRFFADATLSSGETVTAHCPNTGSMKTCGSEGDEIWLLPNQDPKRKLKYTWEFTGTDGGLIGVNTARPNQVVKEALERNAIEALRDYRLVQPEKKVGASRIDFFLSNHPDDARDCYVEVKNVTLLKDDQLAFPDAITERGKKHLLELEQLAQDGKRAVLLFFANRPEGNCIVPADDIDPEYGKTLRSVVANGVEVIGVRARSTTEGIVTGELVDVNL